MEGAQNWNGAAVILKNKLNKINNKANKDKRLFCRLSTHKNSQFWFKNRDCVLIQRPKFKFSADID